MNDSGYFKFHRKACKSAFWMKKPYAHYRGVWLTMLMMTNWKEGHFDGHIIKPGQFATSIMNLSKECGITMKQTRGTLEHFQNLGMITVQNTANRFSMITICNWEVYNGAESEEGQTKGKPRANRGQTEGKPRATIEEVKEEEEVKEGKEDTEAARLKAAFKGQFEEFWNAYPRKVAKPNAIKALEKALKAATIEQIMAGLSKHAASWTDKQFIPHPATWLNREGWNDEVITSRSQDKRPANYLDPEVDRTDVWAGVPEEYRLQQEAIRTQGGLKP